MAINNVTNTTVNEATSLNYVYDRSLFELCERNEPRYWDDLQEADDTKPLGKGLGFILRGAGSHSAGNPDEGGDYSEAGIRVESECFVSRARFDSTVMVSADFLAASEGDGSYSGDEESDEIVETTLNFYTYMDSILGASDGTLLLATVAATVTTDVEVDLSGSDDWNYKLRDNQPIDFYSPSGVLRGTARIVDIDYNAGTIEIDTPLTLTIGDGVYQRNVYGATAPNTFRTIIDDGRLASSIFGNARDDKPYLQAFVDVGSNGSPYDDISEEAVDRLCRQVTYKQNKLFTVFRSNFGLIGAYKRLQVKDRIWMVSGKGVPTYESGADESQFAHHFGDKKIPWKTDRNLPGRQLFGCYWPGFKKHTLIKPDWFREKGGPIFDKVPSGTSGGTFLHAYVANMYASLNQSHRYLNAQALRKNFKDPDLGDA